MVAFKYSWDVRKESGVVAMDKMWEKSISLNSWVFSSQVGYLGATFLNTSF